MTLAVAGAVRGRPATTAQGLARSLERARIVNHDLRSRFGTHMRDEYDFASEVRARAHRIHLAIVADRPDLALHEGGAMVAAADRRIRQIGSVVL
jgi:hypothetical protein